MWWIVIADRSFILSLNIFKPNNSEINRDSSKAKRYRYLLEECEVRDIASEASEREYIEVAGLNLTLLKESDDRAEFICIPVTRINDVKSNGEVELDGEFIASTLNVKNLSKLASFLFELESMAQHRAEALAARVAVEGKAAAAEVTDFLMLQTINRYLPVLKHYVQCARLSPYELYMVLLEMVGELSTFTQANRKCVDTPAYQQAALTQVFNPLIEQLKRSFSSVLEQKAVSIPLQERSYGVNVGVIADKSLLANASFVLVVSADIATDELKKYFVSQVKVGSVDQIRELVNVQLPGIQISSLAVAPRQIPYQRASAYFELVQQGEYWQALAASGGIAIHVGGNFPGLKLELWAIRES